MPDPSDRLQIHDGTDVLSMGPRSARPDDTLVASIGHTGGYSRRAILLTRAQVAELHEFTTKWLAEGWPGVPQVEGRSTADVVRHFRDIAVRYQVEADHARSDTIRQVDAALALIPADRRSVDLAVVAKAQSEMWRRLQTERDDLEELRLAWLGAMWAVAELSDAVFAKPEAGAKVRAHIRKMIDRQDRILSDRSGRAPKGDPPDAPMYDTEQLALF